MQVGAHYYAWYHDDWKTRTLRNFIKQAPENGWYNNVLTFGDPSPSDDTVKYHFELCKKNGIDFLLVSQKNEDLLPYLDIAEEFDLKLAAHCETLGKAKSHKVRREDLGKLLFDAPRLADWMHHPAWFRMDGKPLIAYYVTRQIADDCIDETVQRMRGVFGDCFLLGDEIWWHTPKEERLKLFDGIFGYNMYINKGQKMDKGKVVSDGPTGEAYLKMIVPYERAYYEVARKLDIKFFPTVLPGYNDRSVRYDVDHYALPRQHGKFFNQYLKHSQQFLGDNVLLVTSFNEWYEDSQLEPTIESSAEVKDERDLTNSIEYEAYGHRYLQILKDFKGGKRGEQQTPKEKPDKNGSKVDSQTVVKEVISNSGNPTSLSDDELLDACAILYYQTTVLPILAADKQMKHDIQKLYYENTEEAARRGMKVKQIRQRIKQITHFFSCNRDILLKTGGSSP